MQLWGISQSGRAPPRPTVPFRSVHMPVGFSWPNMTRRPGAQVNPSCALLRDSTLIP
jgi:hypothetical protein